MTDTTRKRVELVEMGNLLIVFFVCLFFKLSEIYAFNYSPDYAYSDTKGIFKLIEDNEKLSSEEKQRQKDGVHEVVKYCKNEVDCRRVQVLQYFDQTFNPADCHSSCNNCLVKLDVIEEDVSEAAKTIIQITQSLLGEGFDRLTRNHCIAVFRGSNTKEDRKRHV